MGLDLTLDWSTVTSITLPMLIGVAYFVRVGHMVQHTMLGDPKAGVTLYEYGDLQCPVCKEYSEQVLPKLIAGPVHSGEAKIEFRNFTISGTQSPPAGVPDIAKWNTDRKSKRIKERVSRTGAQAEWVGFTGTPSFAVKGPSTNGLRTLGTPGCA